MLVTNYRVLVTNDGDGIIAFLHNQIVSVVLIPNSNAIAKEIFDKYYDQLSYFKYRFDAIAKWIVRDLRKEGFIFKAFQEDPLVYIPVYYNKEEVIASKEKLHWIYYEQELIKKKLSDIYSENEC